MHDTALLAGAEFFRLHGAEGQAILDIGALDVNGSLRVAAPNNSRFTGVDLKAGPGVDLVVAAAGPLPFADDTFDLVVSTSAFEHDPCFWVTVVEALRVLKPGGLFYFNAPANGSYHAHPTDNWRFYPDAGLSLVLWARQQGVDAHLVESGTCLRQADAWDDFFAIIGKGPLQPATHFLSDRLPRCVNVRHGEGPILPESRRELAEDALEVARLRSAARTLVEVNAQLAHDLALLNGRYQQLLGSRSLRYTAPFRRLIAALRSRR
jgi:SAM-dependent methyltransferase